MSTDLRPQKKAMYVASDSDKEWLLNVQRKLYTRSWEIPNYVFCKLWGFVTEPRNLRCSLARVARNKGSRTAGVDGVTVRMILEEGVDPFIDQLRLELRSREFKPSPVRRVFIPKTGKPGEFRPLGIPTVKDRVVGSDHLTSWKHLWRARCRSKAARRVRKRGLRRPLDESRVWRRGPYSYVRREALEIPRDKRARHARVGPGDEGGRERRRDWTGGLQEPSGLKCP